jgi:acyl carrier protein
MEVKSEIKEIMSRVSRIDVSELDSDIKFREELGVDSLMAMEIVATCEKQLDIQIDEGQLYTVETIGDFESLVMDIYEKTHGKKEKQF